MPVSRCVSVRVRDENRLPVTATLNVDAAHVTFRCRQNRLIIHAFSRLNINARMKMIRAQFTERTRQFHLMPNGILKIALWILVRLGNQV